MLTQSRSKPPPRLLRLFLLGLGAAAIQVGSAPVPALAQGASIGIYSDQSGNICSFSGNSPGTFTAYIVCRPNVNGVTAVEFAAPPPSCLGAVIEEEILPIGALAIGSVETGISIVLPQCSMLPTTVLKVIYSRTGSTTPCCEYPIVADLVPGVLSTVDCAGVEVSTSGVVSHFNADASCPCAGNSQPSMPDNPMPNDLAVGLSVMSSMSWTGSDIDGNLAEFDLYLGTSSSPPLVAAGLTQPGYTPPSPLEPLTRYYWRVVARDALGLETSGFIWTFTTRLVNSPPGSPRPLDPLNGAQAVPLDVIVRWMAADIDDDPLVFDLYFGTSPTPPLVATDFALTEYSPGQLSYETTYYWRVVARDPLGQETSGPVWSFVTRPVNFPPDPPENVSPYSGANNQPVTVTLTWSATDADNDTLVFDVYLGTVVPPPLAATGVNTKYYSPGVLAFGTKYYWRIVARDGHGGATSGTTTSFTTRPENYPPTAPSNPVPANGATNQLVTTTLAWQSSDPDGHAITYDVYFGTTSPPPLIASNVTTKTYAPGLLAFATTYRWKIVARDELGATTSGSIWSFSTRVANYPPSAPSSPSPANNATNRPVTTTLGWQCSDSDGDAITYDVYFGTASPPPLVASNVATKAYAPGPLAFATTYRWKIVARDAPGAETSGPIWSFTTKANSAPTAPSNPNPPNNSASLLSPTLSWTSTDVDGQPLTHSVYFGTTSAPPMVASGLTAPSYTPGTLEATVQYFWRVVVSDGVLSTSGPTWKFTAFRPGDVDADGVITLADASCALKLFVGTGDCAAGGGAVAADINCSGFVTPRDARCIHKHVLNGSCTFCGESGEEPASAASTPLVTAGPVWESDDTLNVSLFVAGVPSLESFGFNLIHDPTARLVGLVRRSVTTAFEAMEVGVEVAWEPIWIGGYTLGGVPAVSTVELVRLRFVIDSGNGGSVLVRDFVDDLEGANPLFVVLGGGGSVPVLFTRFDAVLEDGGVDVRWELTNDEAMESFALYRREGAAPLADVIAQGPVNTGAGSYLDRSAGAGKTYRYEMLVQTQDGDAFRSPVATVTTPASSLVLGQNHPNPFNPQTTIPYELPSTAQAVHARLVILDTAGRVVRTLVDEDQAGGSREAVWNGRNDAGGTVSSGVYFYVLDAGGERRTRKLVLLK